MSRFTEVMAQAQEKALAKQLKFEALQMARAKHLEALNKEFQAIDDGRGLRKEGDGISPDRVNLNALKVHVRSQLIGDKITCLKLATKIGIADQVLIKIRHGYNFDLSRFEATRLYQFFGPEILRY